MHVEPSGSEVENAGDARLDHPIRDGLSGVRGNRDDPDLDVVQSDLFGEVVHRADPSPAVLVPDHALVRVEHRCDVEILLGETLVGEKGPTDVARTDERGVPGPVAAEHLTELLVETVQLVSDPGVTELAEEGEILADLGTGETEGVAQLTRADGSGPRGDQGPDLAKVEAESLDRGSGDPELLLHEPSLADRHYNPDDMHIDDVFQRDRTTFSFEFFPPSSEAGWQGLEETIESLNSLQPSFVSVTYGAGGSTRERTHDLVRKLKSETTLDPAPHLTCVAHDRDEIQRILETYAASGISNLLALRGDVPQDVDRERAFSHFRHAADLVTMIRDFNESGRHPDSRGFGIGIAGFPEGHPETPNTLVQMDHLKAKVDAGADWICTQLFFDNNAFYDWRERCEIAGIDLPIVAGIMPITSIKGLKRMADLAAGTRFPASLMRSLHRIQDDPEAVESVGTHWATEQCRDLVDRGTAGIHFYTLNRSQATRSIFRTLGAGNASQLRS